MVDDLLSAHSEDMRVALDSALARQSDVVALLRYSRAAGSRDWFFLTAASDLDTLLSRAGPDDSLALFLTPELPIRGPVDDTFAARCRDLFAQVTDWSSELLVAVRRPVEVLLSSCESMAYIDASDLELWLAEHRHESGVAGLHPDLFAENSERLLVGYVPREDGTVHAGVY